jgi:hypothetical protein
MRSDGNKTDVMRFEAAQCRTELPPAFAALASLLLLRGDGLALLLFRCVILCLFL